jgi:predicted nucleic acid-binding protein
MPRLSKRGHVVLDATVIAAALVDSEKGHPRALKLLQSSDRHRLFVSMVNLAEAMVVLKRRGILEPGDVVRFLVLHQVEFRSPDTRDARKTAEYDELRGLGDRFAAATAEVLAARLATGDEHLADRYERRGGRVIRV